jgi:hypothetical protein
VRAADRVHDVVATIRAERARTLSARMVATALATVGGVADEHSDMSHGRVCRRSLTMCEITRSRR